MTRQPGLVSTIIPVYNRPGMLREAVASVLAQTYRPIEILIVDDGSTDDTAEVALALAEASPSDIRVIQQPNAGVGRAREAGRATARGEFIQYLDSDDVLLPTKFALQVAGLRERPDCGVSYGWTRYRHRDGSVETKPWKESGIPREAMFPSFLRSRWWDTPTPLYRATVCDRAGPWSDLRAEEDWEYDCRIAALGTPLHHVPEFVAEVRDHGDGRLSGGEALNLASLRTRVRSHSMILGHALRAGVSAGQADRQHFARQLFFLARQCGAAGLAEESQVVVRLARAAASGAGETNWDMHAYAVLGSLVGWKRLGRLSHRIDAYRNGRQRS